MSNPEFKGWWRPSGHPGVPLPFGARSVGRADFDAGWKHPTGQIAWVNMYWGDENTQFGQFENSSNIQVGLKYIIE